MKAKSESDQVAADGRFLRKRIIGKTVHVLIDYVKPKDGEYEERECVTISYGTQNTCVAAVDSSLLAETLPSSSLKRVSRRCSATSVTTRTAPPSSTS